VYSVTDLPVEYPSVTKCFLGWPTHPECVLADEFQRVAATGASVIYRAATRLGRLSKLGHERKGALIRFT
jgi:hypothetical protein